MGTDLEAGAVSVSPNYAEPIARTEVPTNGKRNDGRLVLGHKTLKQTNLLFYKA